MFAKTQGPAVRQTGNLNFVTVALMFATEIYFFFLQAAIWPQRQLKCEVSSVTSEGIRTKHHLTGNHPCHG